MKKILLAINGSAPRDEAIGYALALAQRLRARLEVLQVVSPAGGEGPGTSPLDAAPGGADV